MKYNIIQRNASDYTNVVEIIENNDGQKFVKKTHMQGNIEDFWFWCRELFGINIHIDPGEQIVKYKKLRDEYHLQMPELIDCNLNSSGFSFLYEFIKHNQPEKFEKKNAMQYGEFVGKTHKQTHAEWGNLYDTFHSNQDFGNILAKQIEKNIKKITHSHRNKLLNLYDILKSDIESIKLKESVLIMLDVDSSQYIFNEQGDITGIIDTEALVLGPKEIELLMWEFYLKDSFSDFLVGYTKYVTYYPENIEVYKFLILLLDSLGSDFNYYDWFHKKDIFSNVEIEINTNCNRKCTYCPNSKYENSAKEMKNETFKELMNQLSLIEFEGRISYHFYNEPLLCKKLIDYVRICNQQLPQVRQVLYSNGDFLNEKNVQQLIDCGIDMFIITNHNTKDKRHIFGDVLKLFPEEIKNKIIYIQNKELEITNRSGIMYNSNEKFTNEPCQVPSCLLVIDVDGNVIPCYEDYHKELIMGNILNENILEIWNSMNYKEFRNYLRHGKRNKYNICKNCDNITLKDHEGVFDYFL